MPESTLRCTTVLGCTCEVCKNGIPEHLTELAILNVRPYTCDSFGNPSEASEEAETMRKARKYFTIVANDHGRWTPQFGDFSRETVTDELRDMRDSLAWHGAKLRIIPTGPSQHEIDAAVAALNAVHVASGLAV